MKHPRFQTIAVAAAAAALAFATAVPAQAGSVGETVVDDLAAPLGFAIGSDGTIYVTQNTDEDSWVTEIRKGEQTTVGAVSGPIGIGGVEANGRGTATYVVGGPIGTVNIVNPSGRTRTIGNVAEFEAMYNPDAANSYGFQSLAPVCADQVPDFVGGGYPFPGIVDSNAYAVEIMPNGDRIVADAGGNTLVRVTTGGAVSVVAVMPPRPIEITPGAAAAFGLPACTIGETYNFDFVPTDVELGPDGLLYVTSLPGGPPGETPLGSNGGVFTVHPGTGAVSQIANGFLGATDLAVAKDGSVYVAELFANQVSKVVGGAPEKVVDLAEPAAVEIAKGTLYATSGLFGGPGSIVTITP